MATIRLKAVPKPSKGASYYGAAVYPKEEAKADKRATKRIGSDSGGKQKLSRKVYKQEEDKAAKASKKVESKANKQLKTGKKYST